jgi:pimeloyl-ACP methyl ester carboxylesterase
MLSKLSKIAFAAALFFDSPSTTLALSSPSTTVTTGKASRILPSKCGVAYKPLAISLAAFEDVKVPVACWFPVNENDGTNAINTQRKRISSYKHRISIRRIGQLLARWNFIPDFASRDFDLRPGVNDIWNGNDMTLPAEAPVVLLAHGFLGSRFDLSHLAEKLAAEGFVCLAAEYPESLAASFDRVDGLTRSRINEELLSTLESRLHIKPKAYGVIGHSLGCGTALDVGDHTWARVCVAGFPRRPDGQPIRGNVLFLSSMNDGAVSMSRFGGKEAIPSDVVLLDESQLDQSISAGIPKRAAVVFDRPDAPNHISFLSEGVNDAMIDLLSPLLPLAKALSIPVLDFDRYQMSRDSLETGLAYHPVVIAYLKQQMQVR